MRVLAARGTQAESSLGFAALHRLLAPVLDHVGALPDRHREALLAAFGFQSTAAVPSRLFVALAALELIAEASAESPVVIAIDDLPWVDSASREAIEFVARRLEDEPVLLLLASRLDAVRSGAEDAAPLLVLEPLDDRAAQQLLREHAGVLPATREKWLLDAAAGNPLALVELPRAAHVGGRRAESIALTERLERTFSVRLDDLDDEVRTALLVASVQDSDRVSETRAAVRTLDAGNRGDLEPAVSLGLLRLDGDQLRFRHPLVRSAVARSAAPERRRAAHRALAATLGDHPDRATWHRALAATGADEPLAVDLEAGAGRAVARGAPDVAQEWFERAAEVSLDEARRGHRLVSAAELAFELGRHQVVGELMAQARATPLTPADYARLAGLEGVFDEGIGGHEDDVRRLTDAAGQALGEGDHEVAAALLLGAAMPCYWGGPDAGVWALVRDGIEAVELPAQDPRIMVVRALIDPYERGELLVSQLAEWEEHRPTDPALTSALGRTSFVIGDFDHALKFAHQASEALRRQGRLSLLTATLVLETFASLYLGRWSVTKVAADEAHRFAVETRQPVWEACANLGRANLLAVQGSHDEALALAARVERIALDAANRSLINGVQLTRGLAGLGAARPEYAFVELARMFDRSDPAYHAAQSPWAVDYLAEAAALSNHRHEAARLLAEVEGEVKNSPAPGLRRAVTLARALLCEPDDAEADFDAARQLSAVAAPWYRARVELGYGSWLRRRRRVAESRQPLMAAQSMFVALEADAWAARAQQELAATGRRPRERSPEAWSKLSAQELQIVRLAAEGLSNREIGERLYLSHRTVGSHLYRAFPKLGVRSRAELHAVLQEA